MRNTKVAQGERLGRNLSGNAWTLVSSLIALFYFCWIRRFSYRVYLLAGSSSW